MSGRTFVVLSCLLFLTADVALAQAPGGPGRGGRGGPPGGRGAPPFRGGTERLVDELPLTSMQQGLDARAAILAYDQTVRQQTLQARAGLLERMRGILTDQQFAQFKDDLEQIPLLPQLPPPQQRGIATADLVDHVLEFDKDRDDRITRDELPERMLNLMAQGDTNHDDALDRAELRGLATRNSAINPPPGARGPRRGGPPPGQ